MEEMNAIEGAFPLICFYNDIRLNNLRSKLGLVPSNCFRLGLLLYLRQQLVRRS